MNNPRDNSSPDKSSPQSPSNPAADSAADDQQSTDSERSGRISDDERDNAVWEWQLETGVYSRDVNTQRLKKLELDDLSIAETGSYPTPPGLNEPDRQSLPGDGVNPYDNSTTGRGNVATDSYNSAGRGALKPEARSGASGAPTRGPVDSNKLEEWLELRKRVEQNPREQGDD